MGIVEKWIQDQLNMTELSDEHKRYLARRGVDEDSSVKFHTWKTSESLSPCSKFAYIYGQRGEKIDGQLVYTVRSPRDKILGMEARRTLADGSKKVFQYRTKPASWNPYLIGSEKAFNTLWSGCDLWIVEGVFDLISVEKVIPSCDAVCSTLRAGMDKITLDMIARFAGKSSTVFIAYDNDETGQKKAKWLKYNLNQQGVRSEIWKFRGGKDPNEIWMRGKERALRRAFL